MIQILYSELLSSCGISFLDEKYLDSILDIIEGHILTGIARLVNASTLIVCIAIGLFLAMLILGLEKL